MREQAPSLAIIQVALSCDPPSSFPLPPPLPTWSVGPHEFRQVSAALHDSSSRQAAICCPQLESMHTSESTPAARRLCSGATGFPHAFTSASTPNQMSLQWRRDQQERARAEACRGERGVGEREEDERGGGKERRRVGRKGV